MEPTQTEWTDVRIESYSRSSKAVEYWRVRENNTSHVFFSDKWEMKVSFIRKPRPFEVGDRVRPRGGRPGVIDAVSTAYGGVQECWFRCHDGSHTTYYGDFLEHVDDDE